MDQSGYPGSIDAVSCQLALRLAMTAQTGSMESASEFNEHA